MSPHFSSGWLILTLVLPGFVSATLPTPTATPATAPTAKVENEAKAEAEAKAEVKPDTEAKPKPDRAGLEKLVAAAAERHGVEVVPHTLRVGDEEFLEGVDLDPEAFAAAAERHGVELALVKAVVAAESAYDPQAVSRAGARGLMQVMPATAADYGVADQERLFDPETNLDTGTRHLKRLLAKYKNDYGRAIMAYNAGEGVVDRTGSMVTYAETLSYTEAVIRHYRRQGGTKPTDEALAKVRQLRKLKGQQAKQLLAKYLDLNLPSLRGSSRTIRVVAPGLDENSAKRRPMIVLETKKPESQAD